MSTLQLVNVWTDPEPGPGGFNPMATSLLWLPEDHRPGQSRPAFVVAHRWGGYPHDPLPRRVGQELADRGCACLCLCLRRRGMEGQLMAMPDNDLRDVKLAVDYLHTNGFDDVFLVGEEVGALSVLNYTAKHKDMRVKGVALIDPVPDLADWLRDSVGAETYANALSEAGVAARQGTGMDYRIDLFPVDGPTVTQQAGAFLAWWSPMADTRMSRSLQDNRAPVLVLAEDDAELPEWFLADPAPGQNRETGLGSVDTYADRLERWAVGLGARKLVAGDVEIVDVVANDKPLYGLLWHPASRSSCKTAVLLMHGLSSSPTSPLFGRMAPVITQRGLAALAIESHRSGWAGHEAALLDDELDDLDAWVEFLLSRGIENVVLAGASMGSLSVGRWQSIRQHPNILGVAHLMPTADGPEWFRAAAGDGPYQEAVTDAQAAIDAGSGDEYLIDIDIRQPEPSLSRGRFRWTQRAASWLSYWGPDADSRNSEHIASARVPLLLLSGTADSYNDKARFAQLREAAALAPSIAEIWYEDVDHGLGGVERNVADDLCDWIENITAEN
jgi:alpha-beta hydrolase superfamily lysophospholipase